MTADTPELFGSAKSGTRPRVLLLSAYDAGSHARWRNWLTAALPEFEWHTLTLPARYFRWRIRGNPLSWLNEPLLDESWDALVVTTMVDLATLRGLKPRLAKVPALAYCHENQFVYPQQGQVRAGVEPQMVNLCTALSAERVLFNSEWNRRSFLSGVAELMSQLPDKKPNNLQGLISSKSAVLPVPIADEVFLDISSQPSMTPHVIWNLRREYEAVGSPVRIVWAARWEHDKGPKQLLAVIQELERRGTNYSLCILGERFRQCPDEFVIIEGRFKHRIAQFGRAESREDYLTWLRSADIILSTALHEFQGIAVLEAVASGCTPVLPDRLAYPETVEREYLYESWPEDLQKEASSAADKIEQQAILIHDRAIVGPCVKRFASAALINQYRAEVEALLAHSCR